MLFGHLAFDNFFAVVAGLIDIALGLALIRWRIEFTRASALAIGVGFVAFGVLKLEH